MYATITTISPKGKETKKTISHLDAADTIRRMEEQRGFEMFIAGSGTAYISFPDGWKYMVERYFTPDEM